MKRPAFKVTGGVACALCLVGFVKVVLEPYLPNSPTSQVISLTTNPGVHPPVRDIMWKSDFAEALREAKNKDKGLLVFLLEPSNLRSRILETELFRDDEIVRFVRRHFVAVRVNLDVKPESEGLLYPLLRTQSFFVPGCTLFVADPKGTVLVDRINKLARYPYKEDLQLFLSEAKNAVASRARNPEFETSSSQQVARDATRLRFSPSNPFPETDQFLKTVRGELEETSGGFSTGGGGIIQFRPLVIRFLMQQGRVDEAVSLAKRALRSPLYDVIDGGFFESMEWGENRDIDTSKRACRNALAAEVLAELYCLSGDSTIREGAMDVAKSLTTTFLERDVFIAGRSNDVSPNRRSHRHSLTLAKMSRILSDEDILWVNDFLLRRKDVGRELPTLISLTVLQDKNFDRIRNILRLKLPTTPSATQNDRIDIMGYVAARLYRVGTLLDRPDFVEVAVQQADKCFSAVTPSSVNRFYGRSEAGAGWLGTYLGVVDVALADYIYSGRPSSLDLAKQVYGLVTDRFGVPGTSFLGCEENNISVPLTANLPQVVDIEGESPSAMAIRLGFALNVLESDPARRETGTMQISGVSGSFAPLLSQAGSIVAGYYTVAKCAIDPKGILVVGGDVERRVQQFCRKYPTSWVFPVVGDLRPDWKLRQNNVYEFQGSQIVGDALAKPTPNLP